MHAARISTTIAKNTYKAYKEAANLFKQTRNRSEELECEAEAFYVSASVADSVMEGKKAFSRAYELFIESSELYSKEQDQESFARVLSRACMQFERFLSAIRILQMVRKL